MTLYVTTFLVCVVSGFVPLVNAEAYLVVTSAAFGSPASILPLALVGASGQMAAKLLIYLAGRGVLRLPLGRVGPRIEEARLKLQNREGSTGGLLFLSASVGLPPFYVITILLGMIRYHLGLFLLLGTAGRFIRFAVVAAFPGAAEQLWIILRSAVP
jgi:membrane protein YqaA with SNARE-associated domain